MTHYFTWNNPRAVIVCALLLVSMLAFLPSLASAQDFIITTTADFDAGTKTDTVTDTDIENMASGELSLGGDGSDYVIISVKGTTEGQWWFGSAAGDYAVTGNQFRPNRTWLLSKIAIWIVAKTGSPGDTYIRIYELVEDVPDNSTVIASSVAVADGDISTGTWHNFSFSPLVELEYNRKYAFVAELVTDPGGNNYWNVGRRNSVPYSRGNRVYWQLSLGNWMEHTTHSTMFQLSVQERQSTGNFETANIGIPHGHSLSSLTIGYKGVRASQNLTKVEFSADGNTVATYETDITDIWDWTDHKYGNNPVIEYSGNNLYFDRDAAAWPKVLRHSATDYEAFFSGSRATTWRIGRATSSDGVHWTTYYSPYTTYYEVLEIGSVGEWDETRVWLGHVWIEDSTYYMLYSGQNATDAIQVGLASSSDGINWTKSESNPVFNDPNNWAHNESEFHYVVKYDGTYYMYYNTAKGGKDARMTGIATSTDLTTWTPILTTPVWDSGENGTYFQNQFCGAYFEYDNQWYAIMPGYDEEFNYAELRLWQASSPTFSDKTMMKPLLWTGDNGDFDSTDMDTPFLLVNGTQSLNIYYAGNDGTYWQSGLIEIPYADIADALSSETTIKITDDDLTSGKLTDARGNIKVKVYLSTQSHLTPTVSEIKGTYGGATVSPGIVCDFSADVDGSRVFFGAWCDRDDALIFHWIWDFGDGTVVYGDSTMDHEYSEAGSYNVSLEVIDHDGRTASVWKIVTVQNENSGGLWWTQIGTQFWCGAIPFLIVLLIVIYLIWRKRRSENGQAQR